MQSNKMPPISFLERHDRRAENSQELMEVAKTLVTEVFEQDGGIPPTFLFDNPPGGFTSAMQTTWANDNEKHKAAHCIRETFSLLGLQRYAVVVEMFFSTMKIAPETSLADAYKNAPQPRHDPNRREVILICVHEMDGSSCLAAFYTIERPKNAKPRLVPDTKFNAADFVDMTFAPAPKVKQ